MEHRGSTLLEDVQLVHQALPEASLADVDLASELAGRACQAPVLIAAMTGGTAEAADVNAALALAAQKHGLAMGLGSQRAVLERPEAAASYRLRSLAPDIPLLSNLGLAQIRGTPLADVRRLLEAVGADGLCVHLNAAQELSQPEGDRDFRGGLDAIGNLVAGLGRPVVVKETGCGLSPASLDALRAAGVRWVDVSGAGGTSWTRVESLRDVEARGPGAMLRDWGIPTAASALFATRRGLRVIASGGVRDGLDLARAFALGADFGALALPFLRAYRAGGAQGLDRFVESLLSGLRAVLLLTGVSHPIQLRGAPRILGPRLREWAQLDTTAFPEIDRIAAHAVRAATEAGADRFSLSSTKE